MHISEGVLSGEVLAAGYILTAAGLSIGIKKMDYKKIPQVAVLSSAFFIASLIHIPVGVGSVHLVLNGLLGILLSWIAIPAIFLSLLLQALLFQFGGITTLGINTFNMAFPSIMVYYLFSRLVKKNNFIISSIASFLTGFLSVFLSCILVAFSLIFTEEKFLNLAKIIIVAHLPVMIIEGIITMFCINFIKKVKKDILL